MEVKLRLVSTQTLKLAFRSLLLGAVIFGLRSSHFNLIWFALFLFIIAVFYFRPAIGSKKLLASLLTLTVFVFAWPVGGLEIYIAVISTVVFNLVLGVKNLIYLNRESIYFLIHFILVIALSVLVLRGFPPVFAFLVFLLLFQEFYSMLSQTSSKRRWLISGVGALLLTQTLWIINLLPLSFFLGGALTALLVFVFHDLSLRNLEGRLSSEIVLRDATIFIALCIIILLGAKWTLL